MCIRRSCRCCHRWTKSSQWFRNLPQLAAWLDHWQEAAAQLGRRRDMLDLVLSDRRIIETVTIPAFCITAPRTLHHTATTAAC